MICDWVAEYKGKLLIHNTLFDLKLIYHRTGGKLPLDIEDTQLLARTLVNDADDFQCRTGLKVLAGEYYDPSWTNIETYDVVDFKNPAFLKYCAIDACAVWKVWDLIQESIDEN